MKWFISFMFQKGKEQGWANTEIVCNSKTSMELVKEFSKTIARNNGYDSVVVLYFVKLEE